MSHTVIGLFDALRSAQEVEDAFAEAGFQQDRILLAGQDTSLAQSDAVESEASASRRGVDLVETLVQHGVPRDRAEFYAEGIRRGGAAVLLLDLNEAEAERAAAILRQHRPLDPSRRLEALHQFGHGGYTPVASPFVEGEAIPEVARFSDDHYGDNVAVIYVM